MSDTNPHRPDCPASYTGQAPCTKNCGNPRFRPAPVVTMGLPGKRPVLRDVASVDVSTPERPGTAIFSADYGPDGTKTAIRITRADRWIQVSREFVYRMRDEGELGWQPLTIVIGRPDSVMYRFGRKFDEHSDLYERVDDETPDTPDDQVTDLDPEVAELLASNERPVLTVEDYRRINPTCEHGIIKGLITCPRCEPEEQAAAEESVRAMTRRVKGYRNPLQARVDELERVLNEALSSFTQRGNLGGPCVRTGYLPEHVVDGWRRTLARKLPFDEVIERVAGVELTDEQRAMVRTVLPNETDAPWKCERCGSDRWNGWRAGPAHEGYRRLAQCVPCGQIQPLPADADEA
jgi:hypothetical protein